MYPFYYSIHRTGGRSRQVGIGGRENQILNLAVIYREFLGKARHLLTVQGHVSSVTGKLVLIIQVDGEEPRTIERELS